jgi:hypothetical protein
MFVFLSDLLHSATSMMHVRLFRVKSIPGLHWRVVDSSASNIIKFRSKFFPAVSHENFSLQVFTNRDSFEKTPLLIEHVSDISPDDIQIMSEDFTHDYRIRFMGYSSICAACVWSFLVMPNGGWFALLFKDIALPIFGTYSAVRATDMFVVMRGSEKFLHAIEQGNCDFKKLDT